MKSLLLLFCLTALTACASSDKFLTATPLEVDKENLDRYWHQINTTYKFTAPKPLPSFDSAGWVKIRILIDSNGNVFDPQIVESVPAGIFDESGLMAVSNHQYRASTENPDATPVYVTIQIFFEPAK